MSNPYHVQNPATGEVLETFPFATDDKISSALASSYAVFEQWAEKSFEERAGVVGEVAAAFEERKEELARIIAQEMGKPLREGIEEAEFASAIFQYYADHGAELGKDFEIPTDSNGTAYIRRVPIGPLFGIMPWNFPYYQVARFAAPNLMQGNTIILKHAELCPRSALVIKEIMDAAGAGDAYINVFATHDQSSMIISDKRVRGVSLTGSERAGAAVAAQAGKELKKVVLELGGSDPYIVLDSDDIAESVATAWGKRFYNTGQACDANKRLIIMDDIYDDFLAELVGTVSALTPADPLGATEDNYAPLCSREAAERLNDQIQKAVAQGATLHTGGELGDNGWFSPAVLTGITPDMDAYLEELFGPVAVVYRVSSVDEAVSLANAVDFGLGATVFSSDVEKAKAVGKRLEAGMVKINSPEGEGPEMPFGGVKRSGCGRELGPLGMDEFVNKQLFYVEN